MSLRVVLCTAPNKAIAQQIANSLVAEKLAACVNIISGIESVYEWQDQIETPPPLASTMPFNVFVRCTLTMCQSG